MKEPLTVKTNSGRTVLAQLWRGEPMAMTYANRTQAAKAVEKLGEGWCVWQGMGRPFYAAKVEAERDVEPRANWLRRIPA